MRTIRTGRRADGPPPARALLRDCLAELRETADAMWLPFALEGMAAGAAALERRAGRGLTLAGAAEATREAIGRPLWPAFARQVQRWLAPARAALPPEAAEAAWSARLAMSSDHAVTYALGDQTGPWRLRPRRGQLLADVIPFDHVGWSGQSALRHCGAVDASVARRVALVWPLC